ncbi:MAG: bifunctional phosphoglucose/phosphomannose isomerase [Thaumarchaeota archaeon]|nr:bifunctional phosphoglucose/phosphomannose isomerase [Nitrososphaerota archaeon]
MNSSKHRGSLLDNESIRSLDKNGFCSLYDNWVEHCRKGWDIRINLGKITKVEEIFLAGMGGSRVAGELLLDWLEPKITVPLKVVKDYRLPGHARRGLLVAVSCSGNTREILSVVKDGSEKSLDIVTLSSGGELSNIAKSAGYPHITSRMIGTPRTSFPYIFFPLVNLLAKIGIYDGKNEVLESFVYMEEILNKIHSKIPFEANSAKQTADWLHDGIPIIYGANWSRAVAMRFKNQLNENAKMHAYFDILPELCHNEIMSWESNSDLQFRPIFLRHDDEPSEISRRFDILNDLLRDKGIEVREIKIPWRGTLPTALALLLTIDYVSVYAALVRGLDPSSTETIEMVKKRLEGN